ncbi:hypothetical protein EA462_16745 [Natrarchaeobius halalkaliphilus]|uniref:Uncharacterized protein n=1 Tax=Natrarchaeobius halalkaliphilus TaxID=1679091 RepID=A0A3N6LYH3_9EURY|nr:rod-determining factor RdfA [Natrarchaeobius halalkaliphilus]RQG86782.1 hypothetical protein EA462_16745 [Natrarchaeobius halalkaliphilus]
MDQGTNLPHEGDADPTEPTDCCKVGRVALAFDVTEAVTQLARDRRSGDSYRTLAEQFNKDLIESALERADIESDRSIHAALVGDDIATEVYRLFRTDSDSDVRRAEVRARLSDAGVDVDRLESALVSHVTIRSHLTECVTVEVDESPPSFERTVNTTQWAHTRASNVIQSTLDRAVDHGHLRTGPLEAELSVRVTCTVCGDSFYLTDLLDQRRCSCHHDR